MKPMPTNIAKQVESLHSSVKFVHRSQGGDVTIAELRDNHMNKVWASAEVEGTGDDAELRALRKLIKEVNPGDRPKTPAELASGYNEIASENAELKRRIADLTGESDEEDEPEGADIASEADTDPSPDSPAEDDEEGGDDTEALKSLSSQDLADMLNARGVAIPGGDRRTTAWREEAFRLLQQ